TGGPRDAEKERSLSQQALLRRLLPGALAGQLKGLNLNRRRQASLPLQTIFLMEEPSHPKFYTGAEGASSRKYINSVTKTKAADYGHIKWIEDLVPRKMWIQEPIGYDKHALWGVSHWGCKRQQFYGFAVNRESGRDVYSKRRIIDVTELKIVE
nr:hypothetical protein [Tanacetum cinerariifolium]